MDVPKSADVHTAKHKTKTKKKTITNQLTRDTQSLDKSFFTVTPVNNSCAESLKQEYSFPLIDLSHWKDEWKVYAEIISKVNFFYQIN